MCIYEIEYIILFSLLEIGYLLPLIFLLAFTYIHVIESEFPNYLKVP